MRRSISAVFLPLIGYQIPSLPRMKAICTRVVRSKRGLDFTLCQFFGRGTKIPAGFSIGCGPLESQALKTNSAQMARFLSGDFGREIPTFCVISGEIRRYPAKSGDCRIILKRTSDGIVRIQLQLCLNCVAANSNYFAVN